MPAVSDKQQHLASMALAIKHGHDLPGVSAAGKAKARQMAAMPDEALHHFTTAKKPKGTILTGRHD
jgi:hypothetical protein